MPITLTVDRAKDLTILKITGNPPIGEFVGALEAYYQGRPTRNSLWDFSEGSLASFSLETMSLPVKRSLSLARAYSETRSQGKTAAVAPRDLDFGIVSQYLALASDSPHQMKVYRSMAEAIKWLEEE